MRLPESGVRFPNSLRFLVNRMRFGHDRTIFFEQITGLSDCLLFMQPPFLRHRSAVKEPAVQRR